MTPAEFKEARQSLGLTAEAFAAILGYTGASYIYKLEGGTKIVSPQAALSICAMLAFGLPDTWPDQRPTNSPHRPLQ